MYDNNKKRPTDYICEWSEEAVARLNTVTDGKYKYTGSTAVESKLGDTNAENIGNTPSILDSIQIGRAHMAGGNNYKQGFVSCMNGGNLAYEKDRDVSYRDENGKLKPFAEVLGLFKKAYNR